MDRSTNGVVATTIGRQPREPPAASTAPTPDRFEVLEELGRGGMGVVYKARQEGLNRLVALKMILAGGHADEESLRRFQAEAEAVAKLHHPNIVQIHEIGQHEGRPFFALEYVDGGTLHERLAGTPLLPRDAAELTEQLARAVDYAHQRGIVHRDLKPANVLLEQSGESTAESQTQRGSSSGVRRSTIAARPSPRPKITDFGLAKQTESDSGQTRSGAIVGTPSYMAPEQAAGHTKEVGPLADVYSLGAILYETLTGRPPFKASTVVETLQQVTSQDPVPPTRFQTAVPRDLETICLKCLEKDASKRYATAGELADDLRRFLEGVPITARPVSTTEHVWRWARRNKAIAASLAGIALLLLATTIGSMIAAGSFSELAREKQ
ncbi:MAG: serine/threonine protein kinase, partial [Planctomycetes bacterium]|nr:serine/threonine protein kinase [Planctomycetota bacterium]